MNKKAAAKERRRREKWLFVHLYKAQHACVDCGETDPDVLDFDHVGTDKEGNITNMVHDDLSLERINAEIDKCDVVCANCHRRRTVKRRQGPWISR